MLLQAEPKAAHLRCFRITEQIQPQTAERAFAIGEHIGENTGGAASHGPSQCAMPSIGIEIGIGVAPMIGVPSGVMGRKPVQNCPLQNRRRAKKSRATISIVALRASGIAGTKPANSAVPATKIRSGKRVSATL